MANNTTINSELFQNLLVQSQFALYENAIARAVSTVYDYPVGAGKVVQVPIWAGITASTPNEGVAPSAIDTNTTSKTITLKEIVTYAEITDMLRDSAQENVVASLASQMGLALASGLDTELINLFSDVSITASVGTAGSDNTVADIMRAAALIRAQKYSGPLFAVVNPLQAYGIKAAMTATNSYQNSTDLGSEVLGQYFVGRIAGVTILEHAGVAADVDDDATGCVFAPAAFGIAQRGAVNMEQERNAAKRSTDVVMTLVSGAQVLRPELAVKLLGDAA
jgi:N4-gp56 family major capsid protein